MDPDLFHRLTPREVSWRIEKAVAQERRDLERLAQLACWVMNPWLKKAVSVYDLLGTPPSERKTNWGAWLALK